MAQLAYLYLKHLIATSALAGPVSKIRNAIGAIKGLKHPELGLLKSEGWMQDAVLKRLLTTNSNCVDVGAHLGAFTYSIFQLAPHGKHSVIEPIPYKANWLRNRFPNATVHQCAVSDHEGQIRFYENTDNPGFSSITSRSSKGRQKEIKVNLSMLDALIQGHVDFIKIDVEGHEWGVIKGAKELIERSKPVLMFEAGAAKDVEIDDGQYQELFNYLTDLGYSVFGIFDYYYSRQPLSLSAFQSYRTYPFFSFNFLAMPS